MIYSKRYVPHVMPLTYSCNNNVESEKSTNYSNLFSCLLVVMKNNELVMNNYYARPTGVIIVPEVNGVNKNSSGRRSRSRSDGNDSEHGQR